MNHLVKRLLVSSWPAVLFILMAVRKAEAQAVSRYVTLMTGLFGGR